jgi:protein phosphatase
MNQNQQETTQPLELQLRSTKSGGAVWVIRDGQTLGSGDADVSIDEDALEPIHLKASRSVLSNQRAFYIKNLSTKPLQINNELVHPTQQGIVQEGDMVRIGTLVWTVAIRTDVNTSMRRPAHLIFFKTACGMVLGRHPDQQDAVGFYPAIYNGKIRKSLWVVADGMRQCQDGAYASEYATQHILHEYFDHEGVAEERLRSAMMNASYQLENYAQLIVDKNEAVLPHVVTTVAAVAMDNMHWIVAHVGDSRVYFMQTGSRRLQQLTDDHNYARYLVEQEYLSETEANNHPNADSIAYSLGIPNFCRVEFYGGETPQKIPVQIGDKMLICSDGLTDYIDLADLQRDMDEKEPEEAIKHWIGRIQKISDHDDIAIIIVTATQGPSKDYFVYADSQSRIYTSPERPALRTPPSKMSTQGSWFKKLLRRVRS